MRVLITGGPGSGCSSTAAWVAKALRLVHFDSDGYFHKPTDPPFQKQYSPEERRGLIEGDLQRVSSWILSGSVATWGLGDLQLSHGVILDVGGAVRLKRLAERERQRFGASIETGGDMRAEHVSFMEWAEGYETRKNSGRNWQTDFNFARTNSPSFLAIEDDLPFDEICELVHGFLTDTTENKAVGAAALRYATHSVIDASGTPSRVP